jgi:hypothetical protein
MNSKYFAHPSRGSESLRAAVERGEVATLEAFMSEHSNLPGPRGNLELIYEFAAEIGKLVLPPAPLVDRIAEMLDGWAGLSLEAAPVNHPKEILPAAAVLAYGQVAAVRPDWWEDEAEKLRKAATNPRWRVREIVAQAVQLMLKADWERAIAMISGWLSENDPLLFRAAVAAIAEPPLLKIAGRGETALKMQVAAIEWLTVQPPATRRDENIRVLRQGLGYTLSVAVVAAPENGFALLEKLASSTDPDVKWIVRQNLTKHRLSPWPEKLAKIKDILQPDS